MLRSQRSVKKLSTNSCVFQLLLNTINFTCVDSRYNKKGGYLCKGMGDR